MIDNNLFERQMTALVVDDDIAHKLLLESTLLAAGHLVKSVENGKQALEAFQQMSIDIVLMDVNMPIMNGFDACFQIRSLAQGKDIPIILITGMDDHDSIQKAFNVDATDFMIKPVNWPILGHRVSYYLKAGNLFKELRSSEENLKEAQKIALMGTWELDLITNNLIVSEQLQQLSEIPYTPFNVDNSRFLEKLHPDDKFAIGETIKQSIYHKKPFDVEYRIRLKNQQERVFHEQAKVIYSDDGTAYKMLGTVQDITSRKGFEEEVRQLAYYDVLTGLPNREKFKQLVHTALDRAERKNEKAALMFIDLDNFKTVNDTLGHDAGDKLLQSVTQNLKDCLRPSDYISNDEQIKLSLSRLGGDEFTLIVSGLKDTVGLENIASRIHKKLSQPTYIDEQELLITGSIGIAIYPDDGNNLETLLKYADIAMYKAKEFGRNGFQFYSNSLNNHSAEKLNFEIRLKKSIENNELELHYQPQIETKTGRLVGVEALVRWNDPENGLVSPNDFISVAEKSNLILALDNWVINTACQQAAAWQNQGLEPLLMSVNISGKHFQKSALKPMIEQALTDSGLSPEYLEIELSESSLIEITDTTIALLNEVQELGIKLAIDDFGVGFSSLNYIRKFSVDTLKIDKSLIDNITTDVCEAAITKAIIDLAKTLNLSVVAEGVEHKDQLAWLQQHECRLIQGYIYSKPLPLLEIERYFEQTSQGAIKT
ncbi:EAL domain-containing protein [Colwellia sp. BRX10-3]|uniref:EAL domain-containing protein n=1 Tax=Colwellia sp. BRX10-3 TaxID=2759844 RepID=UPI0015F67583|nr:EAL domain-containing protein [Colwellia sp. BRX10-3]MBA6391572.1 EAL domain-containing protein [Colwellia sp. BRX10-3]